MSVPERLTTLAGRWTGTSILYLPWLEAPKDRSECASTAEVRLEARGKFWSLRYTWTYDGTPQEGFLLLGAEPDGDRANSAWVDSWHQSAKPSHATGTVTAEGAIDLFASYPAPPDPDWGWRTVVEATGPDAFRLVMYNVTPQGEASLAVESTYVRDA